MKNLIFTISILFMIQTGFSQTIGSVAKNFALDNTNNETFILADQKGKVVVLFFFGYACPSCIAIAPSVQKKLADAYNSNNNFTIVGIDAWDGNTSQVKNFASTTQLKFDALQKGSGVANSLGTSYDKIVVIDKDGKIAFKGSGLASSHINEAVSVVEQELQKVATSKFELKNSAEIQMSVYPNPAKTNATLNFNLNNSSEISYTIYNLAGKVAYSANNIQLASGINTIELPIEKMNKGLYFITLSTNKSVYTERFIVN